MENYYSLSGFNEFDKDYKRALGANFCESTTHQHNIGADTPSTISQPVLVPAQGLGYFSKIQDHAFGREEQVSSGSIMGNTTPLLTQPLYQRPFSRSHGMDSIAAAAPIDQVFTEYKPTPENPSINQDQSAKLNLPTSLALPLATSGFFYDPVRGFVNQHPFSTSTGTTTCPPKSTITPSNILQGPTTLVSSSPTQ